MRCLFLTSFIALSLLSVKVESWGWSGCACGQCSPGCVPTQRRLYLGGRNVCYCYCKCSSSPHSPPPHKEPPPTRHQPSPPLHKEPPPTHHQPPPTPPLHKEPPPTHHQPPPTPPACNRQCPSLPEGPVPTPPPHHSPERKTPPLSKQHCDWWKSRIDPLCDQFAKLIPEMPDGPGDIKFTLGDSCCQAIKNARKCYHNLYQGLDLHKSCYHYHRN